jgi:drug/metabolite transporter (DMT)-like permease
VIGTIPYIGEIFALSCAVAWAFAVVLFKKTGETVRPIGLNLFKNTLAFVLFIPTFFLFDQQFLWDAPMRDYALLVVSGALGIGISDTLFFKSLNLLGAGLSAIVDCLYSPFIIGLSIIFLGEHLSGLQIVGVIMIISAVLTATRPRAGHELPRRDLVLGITLGALAMASMAVGIVMIKPLLNESPVLWVVEVRLFAGGLILGIVLVLHPGRQTILSALARRSNWRYMLPASFIGAYLALVIWMAGMKYTQASTAAALNQTSNIFIFLFAALILKEPLTLLRTIAILLAVAGAAIVSFA